MFLFVYLENMPCSNVIWYCEKWSLIVSKWNLLNSQNPHIFRILNGLDFLDTWFFKKLDSFCFFSGQSDFNNWHLLRSVSVFEEAIHWPFQLWNNWSNEIKTVRNELPEGDLISITSWAGELLISCYLLWRSWGESSSFPPYDFNVLFKLPTFNSAIWITV